MRITKLFSRRPQADASAKKTKTKATGAPTQSARPNVDDTHHGDRRQGSQDSFAREDASPRKQQPTSDVAPHLQAIQKMQARKGAVSLVKQSIRRIDSGDEKGPEYLIKDALYTLGFVNSRKRSKDILEGLATVNLTTQDGALKYRLQDGNQAVTFLQEMVLGGKKGLTAAEAQGLRIYLNGVEENLQRLGQDISKVPVRQRLHFLFYANCAPDSVSSHNMMVDLLNLGVLDRNYLPLNNGPNWDRFVQYKMARVAPQHGDAMHAHLERIRDTLFALPTYEP